MNTDEKDKFYKAGYLAGKEHNCPAPETKKFMSNINMEIKYIKEKLENMPTKAEMELANEHLVERIFEKVKLEYVSKTEFAPIKKVIYGVISVVGVAVVSAIIYSVLK